MRAGRASLSTPLAEKYKEGVVTETILDKEQLLTRSLSE